MNAFELMQKTGFGGTGGTPLTSFDVTIETSGVDDTFTLPTVNGYTYNANVDWGDESSSEITAYDDADITHTYSVEGTYRIRITGTFEAWSFGGLGDKDMVTAVYFGSGVLFKYLTHGFNSCSNLETITGQVGDDGIISFLQCFGVCTSLTSIPVGLFDNNTSVTTFQGCFGSCTSLTSSSGELWLNPSGAGNYTLTGPDYDSGIPDGEDCYNNCTGLSDFASIPTYWK